MSPEKRESQKLFVRFYPLGTQISINFAIWNKNREFFMEDRSDVYRTVDVPAEGEYYEKRSKFLAFLEPVHSLEEVKERVEFYQKK